MSENPDSNDTPKSSSGTSEADSDHSGETASPDQATLGGISDDQLPEDLQPGEDNPLAEPLDPDAEETKSQDELEMDATQEDLGNPPVESSSDDGSDADETGGGANSGEGAEGSGIAEG
ncbi:hypothetical protein L2K70_18560 [Nocardioides KLBMP 9356]|uniref:Uncharacterized protein n=1 Tax=Nocardioides potassii TaxID=2911371 RepID=A0ABS9HH49_9ACTN|nr:hypothetical protein [Nocardioides potassii]MCF6379618.1 hypothetical protein [Nocardioides potassii]